MLQAEGTLLFLLGGYCTPEKVSASTRFSLAFSNIFPFLTGSQPSSQRQSKHNFSTHSCTYVITVTGERHDLANFPSPLQDCKWLRHYAYAFAGSDWGSQNVRHPLTVRLPYVRYQPQGNN